MPDLEALARAARGLLPAGTAVGATDPGLLHPLWPGEAPAGAVPRRLAEFSAGRAAARAALAALDAAPQGISVGPDRAPVWPEGMHGTITHSADACLAALRRGAGGLGLDLEPDEDLPADLWDDILLPAERAWACAQARPGRAARLVFSAKEAAYKAQYPLSHQVFGFDMLCVAVRGDQFTARFRRPLAPFQPDDAIHGRHATLQGHILTAASL